MPRPLQICLLFIIALLCFGAGAWYTSSRTTPLPAAAARRVLYYHDPMHPAYKSDRPGTAPDCGMDLEPVYAGAVGDPGAGTPGSVRINPEKQQLIGVRTAAVERAGGEYNLRTVGRVSVDESRVYRLTATVDGWILKAYAKTTGSRVQKGEPLLTFYSRDFLGAEQAYFYSLDSFDRMSQAGQLPEQQKITSLAQIQQNKDALLAMGMGEKQIEEIAAARKLTQEVVLPAPTDGFIIARNVSPGLRFDRGIEFYRVADLSRVWIVADLNESDGPAPRPGSVVKVSWRGKTLRARMTDSAPQFDAASRALRIRLETDNPGELRPDMFVDVELPVRLPDAITVPAAAVVDSGRRTVVYVDRGQGVFDPRAVETGWRYGDRIAITSGLHAGERVVTGGNFLIDSESRLQLAATETPRSEEKDPVCGMSVKTRAQSATIGGRTYWFCSPKCKRDFETDPGKYNKRGA